jgi:hypothetical protein
MKPQLDGLPIPWAAIGQGAAGPVLQAATSRLLAAAKGGGVKPMLSLSRDLSLAAMQKVRP